MPKFKDQLKKIEQNTRHAFQKVMTKVKLDSERDWAREAQAIAENGLIKVNDIVTKKKADINNAQSSLTLARTKITMPDALQKLAHAETQINTANTSLNSILDVQKVIVAQEAIVRSERGKVSSAPDTAENYQQAEIEGKAACRKAQDAAGVISNTLTGIQPTLQAIETEIAESARLIQEAETQQKRDQELAQTQVVEQNLDPIAINNFLLEEVFKLRAEMERLKSQQSQQQQQTSTQTPLTFTPSAPPSSTTSTAVADPNATNNNNNGRPKSPSFH